MFAGIANSMTSFWVFKKHWQLQVHNYSNQYFKSNYKMNKDKYRSSSRKAEAVVLVLTLAIEQ